MGKPIFSLFLTTLSSTMFRLMIFIALTGLSCACVNKEGICPNVFDPRIRSCPTSRFAPTCGKDDDCPGLEKCCATRSGACLLFKCMGREKLLQQTIKHGKCPEFKEIICDLHQCDDEDARCPGDEKCCRNSCGSTLCVKPENSDTILRCPFRVPWTAPTHDCKPDNCATIKCRRKCCYDGCQNFCI